LEVNINTSLPVTFEEIKTPDYINDDRFMCAKVWVCHTGKNLNNSIFSKDTITEMIPSLVGIPIVGYIEVDNTNEEDFAGHEERIIIDNDGVKVEYVGRGYGCVIESNNAKFETKICEDGIEREFLTCEVLLWKQFENCIDIFNRDGQKGHSMELHPSSIEGYLDKNKVFNFTKAKFRALCILGDSKNPAMIGGLIEKFELNFATQFETILTEINESIKQFSLQNQTKNNEFGLDINNNKEGGNDIVDKKLELIAKYNFTLEQLDFNVEEITFEDLDAKLQELSENHNEPSDTDVLFSTTYNQKREALSNALDPKIEKDADGKVTYEEYLWVEDFDDTYVYVEKNIWTPEYDCIHGRYTYTFDETTITATITGEFEKMILVRLTEEENKKLQDERNGVTEQFEKLKGEFEEYKTIYSTPNTEVESLKEFQTKKLQDERDIAETEVFEKFSELEGNEEFETLKSKASEYEIDALEKECFAILGKKSAKFTTRTPSNKTKVKIAFTKTSDDNVGEFDDLFNKHIKL